MTSGWQRAAAFSFLLSMAAASAASAGVPVVSNGGTRVASNVASQSAVLAPSKLDYLVLASMADGSNVLALSAHRAPVAALPGTRERCAGLASDRANGLDAGESGE